MGTEKSILGRADFGIVKDGDGGREKPSNVNRVGASQGGSLRLRLGTWGAVIAQWTGPGQVADKAWEGVSGYLTALADGYRMFLG